MYHCFRCGRDLPGRAAAIDHLARAHGLPADPARYVGGLHPVDRPTIDHEPEGSTKTPASRARVRTFDFDWRVPLWAAYDAIRAALDDEGLTLSDANTRGDSAYSVLLTIDGRATRRVFVPASRILGDVR